MRASLSCTTLLLLGACASDPAWDSRVASIEATLARAEASGAMRCAPRELALSRAHLGFAAFERERGHRSRAEEHLAIAEPNASAAAFLSPVARCSDIAPSRVRRRSPPGESAGPQPRESSSASHAWSWP